MNEHIHLKITVIINNANANALVTMGKNGDEPEPGPVNLEKCGRMREAGRHPGNIPGSKEPAPKIMPMRENFQADQAGRNCM